MDDHFILEKGFREQLKGAKPAAQVAFEVYVTLHIGGEDIDKMTLPPARIHELPGVCRYAAFCWIVRGNNKKVHSFQAPLLLRASSI